MCCIKCVPCLYIRHGVPAKYQMNKKHGFSLISIHGAKAFVLGNYGCLKQSQNKH